jgi:hypothetical protein
MLWGIGWMVKMPEVRSLGFIICGAAVTATIRSYLVTLRRRIEAALIVAVEESGVRLLR